MPELQVEKRLEERELEIKKVIKIFNTNAKTQKEEKRENRFLAKRLYQKVIEMIDKDDIEAAKIYVDAMEEIKKMGDSSIANLEYYSHMSLAEYYFEKSKYEESEIKVKKATKDAFNNAHSAYVLNPREIEAPKFIGMKHLSLWNLKEAKKYLMKATLLNPFDILSFSNLAMVHFYQGELDKSISLLKRAEDNAFSDSNNLRTDREKNIWRNEIGEIKENFGKVYYELSNQVEGKEAKNACLEEASKQYNNALAFGRETIEIYNSLGAIKYLQKNLFKAQEYHQKALAIQPRDTDDVKGLIEASVSFAEICLEVAESFKSVEDKKTMVKVAGQSYNNGIEHINTLIECEVPCEKEIQDIRELEKLIKEINKSLREGKFVRKQKPIIK